MAVCLCSEIFMSLFARFSKENSPGRGLWGHTEGGRVGIQRSERALIATFSHILTQSQEKHCTQHLQILSPRPIWQFNRPTVSKIQQP